MPNLFPIMIGNFEIQGFAAPERLPYGGAQRLGVHQLPGGVRIIDSMGSDDHDLSIKGQLINGLGVDNAVEASRQLDYMRKQGAPINVSWDVYSYICIIATFSPVYEYQSRIAFDMILKVVVDLAAPVQTQSQNQIDSMMSADMGNTLSSSQSLGMNVPSTNASAFSTTTGAQSAGPTNITWPSSSPTTNPDGLPIPEFTSQSDAEQYITSHGNGYSALYSTPPATVPASEVGATNPDGTAVPIFSNQQDATSWTFSKGPGYSAYYP